MGLALQIILLVIGAGGLSCLRWRLRTHGRFVALPDSAYWGLSGLF
jgi:hypothetical protein